MTLTPTNDKSYVSISTFTIKNQQPIQERLIELLVKGIKQIVIQHEGFVATEIYMNEDGTKMINYIRWKNKESYEKLLNDPRMIIQINDLDKLAVADRNLFKLVYSDEKS